MNFTLDEKHSSNLNQLLASTHLLKNKPHSGLYGIIALRLRRSEPTATVAIQSETMA